MREWRLFSGENAYILCMDTIIFFYKKRDLSEPLTEFKRLPGCRLIKVGFCAGGEEWFGHCTGQNVPEEMARQLEEPVTETVEGKGLPGLVRRLQRRVLERKRRARVQKKLEELLAEREAEICAVEEQMKSAAAYIMGKAGGEDTCSYMCEDSLENSAVWSVWLKFFPVKKFEGYLQRFWIEQLLAYAGHHQLVILGSCEEIFGVIEKHACKIKSLRWFLREEDCSGEITGFVEDFYIEYGLAIDLQTVSGRNAYRKLRLTCPEPADILDLTGEPCAAAAGVARGSVWLDAFSSEEKQRRIVCRNTGIHYFSLKESWRRA